MQKTIYMCDHCKKDVGQKPHISLQFNSYSGIATPPGAAGGGWSMKPSVQGKFMHFCNGVCIGRFFSDLLKKAKTK